MRIPLLLALATGLLFVAGTAADDTKKEIEKFQGTWKYVSLDAEGMKLDEAALKEARLIIKGDQFTARDPSATFGGTFKVDVSKKPKTIDVTFTDGPEKGKVLLGIYELEGDTYKVCIGMPGKERPTKFESKPGSGHVLEVLKREK